MGIVNEVGDKKVEVPLPNVGTNTLKKVIEYLAHYQEDAMQTIQSPLQADTFDGVVPQQWYRDFVNVERTELFELVSAANYMEIGEKSNLSLPMFSLQFQQSRESHIMTPHMLQNLCLTSPTSR